MNTSEKNDDNTDSLGPDQDEEIRQVLDSIESFEDVCKTYKSKSAQELSAQWTREIPKSDQEKVKTASPENCSTPKTEKTNTDPVDQDSDYTGFLKQMSVRYSQFRIASGQVVQQKGQRMDYRDYSYNEYPANFPPSGWQSTDTSGQDLSSQVSYGQGQMESPSSSSQNSSYYGYGHSLPEIGSGSDETIVNGRPSAPTLAASENPCCSKDSCGCCCRSRDSGQQNACCHCDQGVSGQAQQLMPVPIGVDPSTGFPIYCYSTPGNYPGNAMYSMPVMQMDQGQRGGGGQHNVEIASTSRGASSSSAVSSNQNPNNLDVEAFMRKYQKSVQQCYATAQQGIQHSFANAQTQPYYSNFPQGTQHFFNNPNEGIGAQQMFGSFNPGPQPFLPPSFAMPAQNFFGNNTGFMNDSLQAQTVYSADYKPFANDGNHFNHFPNGIDIGMTPESCPIYGPAGTAGLAEMGSGGPVYGMGGEMNMTSYPLSQMSYSSPYSYEMPASSPGYIPGTGMPMASPQMQTGHLSGGNPVLPG
ncbi:uncharacterized protein [Drosophila takahashii]|uniref:uncharacterized protein isoform X2 n=1 Tax=Drosophila takahashii TaxID=29030 RepID=UPI0038994750